MARSSLSTDPRRSEFFARVAYNRDRITNHPGHGSQKSHGRKGGGGPGTGRDMSQDHAAMKQVYDASIDEGGQWESYDGDQALEGIAAKQGFDAKPTVVPASEFEAYVKDGGHTALFRGLREGRGGESAEELHAQVRSGDYVPGRGIFGNGFYMAPGREKAESFSDGTPGSVGSYALHRNARTITYTELRSKYGEMFNSAGYSNQPESTKGIQSDWGRYAATLGYDAIAIPAGTPMTGGGTVQRTEYNVLNRGALIAADPG